jgi:aryl-alcohol dehydrogenase-like predicted oxidoreductase
MRTTTLGIHGPQVGVIGLGAMGMSFAYDMAAPRDEATNVSVIHQALDLGMTLIDTADVYGPFTNEELVGRALADRRERAVIATKVGLQAVDPTGGPGGSPVVKNNGRPEYVRGAVDASLRRLRVDRIDLYQLHRVDPDVPLEETWGAMAEAVTAGKVRHLGLALSEVAVEQIEHVQAVHPVTTVQCEFSLWTRDLQAEVLPYCNDKGIGVLPYSPLGRGFLTGTVDTAALAAGDGRRRLARFSADAAAANQAIADTVRRVAEAKGATAGQVAIAWTAAQTGRLGIPVVPIPGTKRVKWIEENAAALDVQLTDSDLAALEPLAAQVTGARY